jgi:mannose-6-phosphate isomerase-like protein (cupin superfamily)
MTDTLETHNFTNPGYKPLVFYDGWQVALLNWEPLFDLDNAGEIERHNQTDEVFVLWRGRALIFTSDGERLHAVEMQPGVVYNVPAGAWHNLLASRDASWIIVENRDTHLGDTQLRQMTPAEWAQLRRSLPEWVKEKK